MPRLDETVTKFFSLFFFLIEFQTELLLLTQLTRESASIPITLQSDFKHVIELAPRLLEELMKVKSLRVDAS